MSRTTWVTRLRRTITVVGLTAGVVLVAGTTASAHALVESSNPTANAILQQAPSAVTVKFTEPPDPELSRIDVLDAQAHSIAAGPAKPVAGQQRTLRVPLRSSLPQGVYTVNWRTTSETDGHTTGGFFSFGVGVSPAGAAEPTGVSIPTTPNPSPLAVAGRWLLYAGLAVLLATATMRFLVFREPPEGTRLVLPIAWAMAALGLVLLTIAEAKAASVSTGTLLGSATGTWLIRQGIVIAVTGIAVAFTVAGRRSTASFAAVGIVSAVGLLFHAFAGHAGASTSWRAFNVVVQWVHLLAVGAWIGGLVWLFVDLRRAGADHASHIRRFSTLAGFALGAVLVSGALRSVDLLGGWTDVGRLLSTGWGNALLWKLGLFALLVGLAAWNRYVNVHHLDERHETSVRRFVGAEALLAAGVFGVTGVLAGLPPASQLHAAAAAPPANVVASGSDFATTTRARLVITPGAVGQNRFEATVTDFDTGRPVDATRVALRLSLPDRPDLGSSTIELRSSSGGLWSATSTTMSIEGRWDVVVVVQTSTGSTEVPLKVQTRAPPTTSSPTPSGQQTSVSRAPGQPDLYTITLPDGSSVQAYLDPARPGPAEVHFTAFDPSGNELPLASASATATSPSGTAPVKLRRLTPGHFVGDLKLTTGAWTFALDATPKAGGSISVSFEQEVR